GRDEAPVTEEAGAAEPAERVVAGAAPANGSSPAAPASVPAADADPAGAQEPQRAAPPAARRRPRRWSLLLGAATGVGMVTGLLGGMLISPPVSQSEPKAKGSVARCTGFECRGKDAQRMECHIGVWTA